MTDAANSKRPTFESVEDAAAFWDARLRSPDCSDADRALFNAWCDESPEQARAYDAAQIMVSALVGARDRPELRAVREDVMRFARVGRRRAWAPIAGAGAVAAAVLVAVLALPALWLDRTPSVSELDVAALSLPGEPAEDVSTGPLYAPPFFATAIGEMRTITLADGSRVTLNTNTVLRERYDGAERRIDLIRGQAEFDVETDPERPFVVLAAGKQITALGTIFDVRLEANDALTITQIEGVVEVVTAAADVDGASSASPAPARYRLEAGDQLVAAHGYEPEVIRPHDVAAESLWRRGQVFFEETALVDAVAEINRYSQTPILTEGLSSDEYEINGMFRTRETDEFLLAIEAAFPVQVDRTQPNQIVVRKP